MEIELTKQLWLFIVTAVFGANVATIFFMVAVNKMTKDEEAGTNKAWPYLLMTSVTGLIAIVSLLTIFKV